MADRIKPRSCNAAAIQGEPKEYNVTKATCWSKEEESQNVRKKLFHWEQNKKMKEERDQRKKDAENKLT